MDSISTKRTSEYYVDPSEKPREARSKLRLHAEEIWTLIGSSRLSGSFGREGVGLRSEDVAPV